MHPAAAKVLFDEDVKNLSPELCKRRGWNLHSLTFPIVDCSFSEKARTTLRVRLQCDDWNDKPPSVILLSADGVPLRSLPANPTGVFNGGLHHLTGLPFVCMRGAREYHTHPSHVNDLWEPLKGETRYSIGGILTQLWNAWQKGSD